MNEINSYSFLEMLYQEKYPDEVLRDALLARGDAQKMLFSLAQERRLKFFPENRAQVRSVIEVSNVCRQKCNYCAIGGKDQSVNYTLSADVMVALMEPYRKRPSNYSVAVGREHQR